MITGHQIKAARALLGLTTADLAATSEVSEARIRKLESGVTDPRLSTLAAIELALEAAGVVFISEDGRGVGVRLRKR